MNKYRLIKLATFYFFIVEMSSGKNGEENGHVEAEGGLGFHHGNLCKEPS